jgi:UDP-N-acetyl-D-mannosaminuronate dehydrogenase
VGGDVFFKPSQSLESVPLTDEALGEADAVVIVTGHRNLDYGHVIERAQLVVDCCNATQLAGKRVPNVVRLGAPLIQGQQ